MSDTPTEESSPTPAAEAARAEMRAVMTDAAHPVHLAFTRNDHEAVQRHMKPFYEKISGPRTAMSATPAAPSSVEIGQGGIEVRSGAVEPQPGETSEQAEARERNDMILAPLKQEWGPNYDRRFAAAMVGMRTLFDSNGEVLDELGARVRMEYGPKGEAAALKFLAELEDTKQGG